MSRRPTALGATILFCCLGSNFLSQNLFAQGSLRAELPSDVMLGRLGLQRAWWAQASIDPLQDRVNHLLADEQVTVVQSRTGLVTVFDNANGRRMWSVQIGDPNELHFAPVTNERLVLIISGTLMYGLDKRTGNVAWQVGIPTAASAPPGMDDLRAYVGSVNGAVYAYDLKFLDQITKNPLLSKDAFKSLKWQYKTGARIVYPPVSTGTVVVVASTDASLYGFNAQQRKLLFQFETDGPLSAPITQFGRLIFVATSDRKAYCLDAETGQIKWELLSGLNLRQAVRVVGDHVFLRPEGYGLRCFSLSKASQLWTSRQAVSFLAATPPVVYASDSLGNVLLLDQKDGHQIGAFSMRLFPIRVANDRTDRMYFASNRGLVVCVREREREFPLFHKNPEKKPVEPEVAPDEGGKPAPQAKKAAAPKKKPASEEEGMEEKKEDGDAAPAAKPVSPVQPKPGKPSAPADSDK
jgi:outer membrane protein assembly factor BamB